MKRLLAVLAFLLVADLAAAQPNLSYSFLRDGAGRPSFGIGLRPVVTPEMGIPPGTPFFDRSTNALYYWDGSAWTGSASPGATFTGPILLPAGTVGAPALAYSGGATTGLWFASATNVAISIGGTTELSLGASALNLNTDQALGWSANPTAAAPDVVLGRESAAVLQVGSDAGSAVSQTLKGPDSTNNGTAGGVLTIRAGAGTIGDAAGGNLNLAGGNNAGAGEEGAVVIVDTGTKPTCSSTIRGAFWYDQGGAGVADTFEVCAKQAAGDTYAWRSIATIP